jgi:hypothetical protein
MPSKIVKGITTIVWGTDKFMASPAGAIIDSGTITPKHGEPIEIEDNSGFAAVQVMLDDGFNAKVHCMYDTAKVWPQVGANVSLNLPNTASNSGNTVSYVCLVGAQPELTQNRKKEAMIQFSLSYRPGVAV